MKYIKKFETIHLDQYGQPSGLNDGEFFTKEDFETIKTFFNDHMFSLYIPQYDNVGGQTPCWRMEWYSKDFNKIHLMIHLPTLFRKKRRNYLLSDEYRSMLSSCEEFKSEMECLDYVCDINEIVHAIVILVTRK